MRHWNTLFIRLFALSVALCAFGAAAPFAEARSGYLMDPDIHGDRLVFTAEGDLWTCTSYGEQVRRITTHVGSEVFPRFSPDGKWIAFTGSYDGNTDVFVIPADGGEPRRLTWSPFIDLVVDWSPDGKSVFFISNRNTLMRTAALWSVPVAGGDPQEVPIGYVHDFSVDPLTGRYAFTRLRGGGTWKRYRGGTAPEIWVGDPERSDYRNVTGFDGIDHNPMWHGGRIWFLRDQGGTMNIWSMRPDGSELKRHTDYGKWDIRHAAMGPEGKIVFTAAGDIHLFDTAKGTDEVIPIDIPSERLRTRVRYPDPGRYVSSFALSPDGERVAVVARGEIFSIPVEKGITLPLTRGSGARERWIDFDPKGKRVLYVSDDKGEERMVSADAWGRGEEKEIAVPVESNWLFPPIYSPDGKWIAFADQTQSLRVVPADGGEAQLVDRGTIDEIREYAWSPDGRWLAYAKNHETEFSSIFIYDTKDRKTRRVTSELADDYSPSWDPDGRYLYFLSQRAVQPFQGMRDYETVTLYPSLVYAILLRPDVENPFLEMEGLPPGDEEDDKAEKDEKKKDDDEEKGGEDEAVEPVEIDFTGIEERTLELPVDPGRYYNLQATTDKVFFESWPHFDRTGEFRKGKRSAELMAFDWEEKEAEKFLGGVTHFELNPKAGKMVVAKGEGDLYVIGASSKPGDDLSDAAVSFENVHIELDPLDEWRQIYYEGWRMMRDFYWDEGMHGVDWKAVGDQYAALLPRISTREELQDLMKEVIGELCNSHTYIWGGDSGVKVPSRSNGDLGAVLVREGSAYRVQRIYRASMVDRIRSPLDEPGVNVKEGEYILAVNRLPFPADRPFEASLEELAGKKVLLTVNDRNDPKGAREIVIEPMDSGDAFRLHYHDWVRRNREYVAEKSGGKIAYVHIPDMGGWGLSEFDKWFYPQLDKEGMVVDFRWNGGGNVSQMIVSRLLRKPIMWGRSRGGGVSSYPDKLLNGPFVALTNEFAGSDGDIGPNAIQLTGAAPVIGKRSWGGVVGIRGDKPFVDGGMETQPEYAHWDRVRGWGMENRGVDPDIEVENLPQDLGRGVDAQLDRAIQEVLRLHAEHPPVKPEFGPAPDYSREAFRKELNR
ncbi:MAG: PD40 domain-containing protein [Candidatus Eisenbacteria bacterium]|nr:PD40 domain-containing protein [Candidatus Eisenbacteria bacterium]